MSGKYLIFGATGSIGSNLALQLSEKNEDMHLISRNEPELNELSKKVNSDFTVLDVLSENFSEKLTQLKSMDIKGIAYCIGSIDLNPIKTKKKRDYENCFKLKFYQNVEVIKQFQENLKENKGSVVLFSTVAGQKGFTNHSIMASVKGALEGLTVALAAEFAPNIRINCIAPSLTNSKIAQPILKSRVVADGIAKAHPMKRIGEGKDSAAMARFLLTDESSWITGQIFGVDGGRSKVS